jgi:hypothetical protein
MTIGTGFGPFVSVADGGDLTVGRGGQGAEMVVGAVRVTGMPNEGTLSFSLSDPVSGESIASRTTTLGGLFSNAKTIECGWELYGQTVIIGDVSKLDGTKANYSAFLSSPSDSSSDSVEVVLRVH